MFFKLPRAARSLVKFLGFRRQACAVVRQRQPQVLVCYMFPSLAAVPDLRNLKRPWKLVSQIMDIPSIPDCGRLDTLINKVGWRRTRHADLVWASDVYKARLAKEFGKLSSLPLVCHNCPTLDYLPEPMWPRDAWLRNELREQGASIGESGGSILLRAGAVGECGGIEETLEAMCSLPKDFIFLMMGRPPEAYKQQLVDRVEGLGLNRRAFLWERPSDRVWKRALQGADIGHLVHGPYQPGRLMRQYELNSSLSNNRLFQYMAAGLPIICYDDPRMNDIYNEVQSFRVARLSDLKRDIRNIWSRLGSDAPVRRRLGDTGRTAHLRKYCWERQFLPILETLA